MKRRRSAPLSVPLFLAMVSLEWLTYVLAAAAGANLGLAFLFPRFKSGIALRRRAVRQAWPECKRMYVAIGAILAVQAVMEILYVRAVLVHGGNAVPLLPY